MSRGRRPEPAELKAAKGNPGKRAIPRVADAPSGAIKPLAKLRPAAVAVWRELAPELARMNFLRPTDRHAFSRYCETVVHYWDVTTQLRQSGDTYVTESAHGTMQRVNPLFLIQERLFKRLTDLEDRFGLSPAARQSIMQRLAQVQPTLPLGEPAHPSPSADMPASEAPPSPIGLLGAGRLH